MNVYLSQCSVSLTQQSLQHAAHAGHKPGMFLVRNPAPESHLLLQKACCAQLSQLKL